MFLLFGFKTVLKALPGKPATCQYCRSFVHHHLEERATKFTLFFIPVFTTSRKYHITCTNCGYVSSITARQKRALELQR
ncbi:zinc-ribbon domain-containing protein [Arthrobacter sp. AFG7.2]|uniref:zinc-ribbon domain-containing protein n=1 Tax=Arthrobacter sp. AFG7.2 TaxID=1688693 RepID=UPI000C9E49FD|nr:zinc-ribbon domain-containing protein [Arthrobacter sp. AFG7.2]PNI08642.1 zinc-ribbon domain-containing protein [Arthrobacter sp. AFG7.2]